MPNITMAEYNELKRAKNKLARIENSKWVEPFLEAFGRNLLTLAAANKRETWPEWYNTAFAWAEKEVPTGAMLYLEMKGK